MRSSASRRLWMQGVALISKGDARRSEAMAMSIYDMLWH
nr:MAG TPA: hypothetical protein [Caudoviricetes sp.]